MVKLKKKTKESSSIGIDPSDRSYFYDEVDDFNDPESNDDSDDYDSKLISEVNNKEYVLGIEDSSEESDESDDEFYTYDNGKEQEEEEDEHVGLKSMGKKKNKYFGTDLTDERIHNAAQMRKKKKAEEEEALEIEKEGAAELQKIMNFNRKASALSSMFSAHYDQKLKGDENTLQEKLKQMESSDVENLEKKKKSKKDKKAAKEWPKLEVTLEEVAEETNKILSPLIQAYRKKLLPFSSATKYLVTKYFLNLNYVTCLSAYMMLKSSGVDMNHHPAEKRLTQFKHLYKEMDPCREKYEDDLNEMLKDLEEGKLTRKKRKVLNVIKERDSERSRVKVTSDEMMRRKENQKEGEEAEDYSSHEIEEGEEDSWKNKSDRRLITYQIKKNKGLLPTRKKEQKNPRVKYKKKYQNKLKRRKGQVREVRKEIKKYGGETSGIKTNVIKSIKLK